MPEKRDDFLRKVPGNPIEHDVHPWSRFDEMFKNEKPQKPFDRFYYGPLISELDKAIAQGEGVLFDYIENNPLPMPEVVLEIVKEKNSDMFSELSIILMERPSALEELGDIIDMLNNPVDFRTAVLTLARLKNFLKQD